MIRLYVSNQTALVWSVDDVEELRTQHRICGLLTGTLPYLAQQNVFLGLPLQLMNEEVVLLVEKGFATIVDESNATHPPTAEERRLHEQQQSSTSREPPAEDTRQIHSQSMSLSEAAMEKRKLRQERRTASKPLAADGAAEEAPVEDLPPPTPTQAAPSHHSIVLPRSSASFPWHHPEQHSYDSLSAAREAGVFVYPNTIQERARCAVYRNLWEQGYYLGTGIKFGGDFLVYPGDPLRYHSHYTATVHLKDQPMDPMEIVAHGRLGTGTRKNHLICGWDEATDHVEYFTVEWSGFG